MSESNINEQIDENVNELSTDTQFNELEEVMKQKFSEIRTQALLLGAQSICSVILKKITVALNKPGKTSLRDYERLVNDIKSFCTVGLSKKVNLDGTTSSTEEVVDESNTLES